VAAVLTRAAIQPASPAQADRAAGRAFMGTAGVDTRPDRALVLLGLASRAAYCLYATAVVMVNLAGYQRPGLAGAALALALSASAGLGLWVWRDQAFSHRVATLDCASALVVLALLAAALREQDRFGALNWALTYAVACAVWLGVGGRLGWRVWPALLLGAGYGVTAPRGGTADPALTVTAVVNAASIPMYFGIAAVVAWVVRRITAEIAARQALEQAQRRDLAALGERERLIREIHPSVLATLEDIASGSAPWTALRGRAGAKSRALRRAFGEPPGAGASGALRPLLAALAEDRASDGWRIGLIDDELTDEPGPVAARALRDAVAELVTGPGPDGCPPVRAQVRAVSDGTELLIRIPGDERAMAGRFARARERLAPAAGTAALMPARPDEVRVLLRVPA
jgi:hypothetical protein